MPEKATDAGPQGIRRQDHPIGQLLRFGMVGALTLVLDFASYRGLMLMGLSLSPSKATGFIVGTSAAYLLNRSWTFRASGGPGALVRFVVLYAGTLLVNVGVNALCVRLLAGVAGQIEVSFLIAQAVSSALNFLGMRFYVFHHHHSAVARD